MPAFWGSPSKLVAVRAPNLWRLVRLYGASLGAKPGSEWVLSMLLESHDLPAGWKMTSEITRRTGPGAGSTEELRRARRAKSVTARRVFMDSSKRRELSTSAAPYESALDAQAMARTVADRLVTNPLFVGKLKQGRYVEESEVHGLVAYEAEFFGANGNGTTRFVAGAEDQIGWTMQFTSLGGWWPWEEISPLTALQVANIETALRANQGPA